MNHQSKLLGLDYGTSSIGVAITDETRHFVFGRETLSLKKGLKPTLEKLKNLCLEEKIQTIVIGLPLDEDGNETAQTEKIRRFAEKLKATIPRLELSFQDESFTSFEADQLLAQAGISAKKNKAHQDELAAILILKRYLKVL